jgi:hypothetical protein
MSCRYTTDPNTSQGDNHCLCVMNIYGANFALRFPYVEFYCLVTCLHAKEQV